MTFLGFYPAEVRQGGCREGQGTASLPSSDQPPSISTGHQLGQILSPMHAELVRDRSACHRGYQRAQNLEVGRTSDYG
jgi:hypothetical protein